jgi:hypothetical protein
MKWALEMSSGAMIYIPGLIKFGSGIQMLIMGMHMHTGNIEIAQAYFIFSD